MVTERQAGARSRQSQSHRQWGRGGGGRGPSEPSSLQELERLARRQAPLMQGYSGPQHAFLTAMDLLRLHHNMTYLMVCETCGTTHNYDPLSAPER